MKKPFLIVVLFSVLAAGCFNVREPEKADSASEWESPTQPDILIANFTAAVQNLNVTQYDRCFLPGFRFRPDPATIGTSTGLFDNWSNAEERDYFNSLANRTAPNTLNQLTLTKTKEYFFQPDSLEQVFDYNLRTMHQDTAFKAQEFAGTMRLIL
ncbi:MAG TPA: hypothetical protein VK927_08955, partial [Adhaeribacter sp.]|nr:hypothetical protein [Adhaeribacter sp.]